MKCLYCDQIANTRGMCSTHYSRYRRGSDLMKPVGKKHMHGMSRTHPLYKAWHAMFQRCGNPRANRYHLYGARGITVCERWNDFGKFLEDMGERPKGHTLDRIDVNGNYEPANCRWATYRDQNINQRLSVRNKSGVKGVYYIKDRNKWAASWARNKFKRFNTKEEAIEYRNLMLAKEEEK